MLWACVHVCSNRHFILCVYVSFVHVDLLLFDMTCDIEGGINTFSWQIKI